MGKRFQFELSFKLRVMTTYIAASSISSLFFMLAAGAFSQSDFVIRNYPFALSFTLFSFWGLSTTYSYFKNSIIPSQMFYFFIGQYLLLLGMSVQQESSFVHAMALFPILGLLFTIGHRDDLSKQLKRNQALLSLSFLLLSFFLPTVLSDKSYSALSFTVMSAYIVWPFLVFYFSMNFETKDGEHKIDPVDRERYFFHDLINHTHSMILSLDHKVMHKKTLDHEQMAAFSKELSHLQNSIQEHFGLAHKNIESKAEHTIRDLIKSAKSNLSIYLPHGKTYVNVKVDQAFESELWAVQNIRIDYVLWQRIIINLIKNASEACAGKVELKFIVELDGLKLVATNDFYKMRKNEFDLGMSLAKIISHSDSDQKSRGVGLESIEQICLENEGQFDIKIRDGLWHVSVKVPYSMGNNRLKGPSYESFKPLNLHKKAS